MRSGIVRAAVGVLAFAAVACAGEDEREVLPPVVLGMLETTAPSFDDGRRQVFQVSREVRLPYRRPSESEKPRGERDPYPSAPFHVVSDTRVAVRFTLSNLDDQTQDVELYIDPWNEFVRYVPGARTAREGEILLNASGIQRPFKLSPMERIQGIVTPDDVAELATDLTVAMALERRPPDPKGPFAGATLYNRVFERLHRSGAPDPDLAAWMPPADTAVAGVVGFDVGLRTFRPAKIAVELVIDIADVNGERVVMDGETGDKIDRPVKILSPPP